MLSFKEVDPSVLGPKYKKNKTTEFKSDSKGNKEAIKNVTEENIGTEEVKEAIETSGPNLRPCPFCSGTAKLVTDMKFGDGDTYFAQIKCLDCGTIGPRTFDKAHDGMFVFDAISKWNRRK